MLRRVKQGQSKSKIHRRDWRHNLWTTTMHDCRDWLWFFFLLLLFFMVKFINRKKMDRNRFTTRKNWLEIRVKWNFFNANISHQIFVSLSDRSDCYYYKYTGSRTFWTEYYSTRRKKETCKMYLLCLLWILLSLNFYAAQTDSGRIRIDGNSHKNVYEFIQMHDRNKFFTNKIFLWANSTIEWESCRVRWYKFNLQQIFFIFIFDFNIVMTLYFNCAELGLGVVNEAMLAARHSIRCHRNWMCWSPRGSNNKLDVVTWKVTNFHSNQCDIFVASIASTVIRMDTDTGRKFSNFRGQIAEFQVKG